MLLVFQTTSSTYTLTPHPEEALQRRRSTQNSEYHIPEPRRENTEERRVTQKRIPIQKRIPNPTYRRDTQKRNPELRIHKPEDRRELRTPIQEEKPNTQKTTLKRKNSELNIPEDRTP